MRITAACMLALLGILGKFGAQPWIAQVCAALVKNLDERRLVLEHVSARIAPYAGGNNVWTFNGSSAGASTLVAVTSRYLPISRRAKPRISGAL